MAVARRIRARKVSLHAAAARMAYLPGLAVRDTHLLPAPFLDTPVLPGRRRGPPPVSQRGGGLWRENLNGPPVGEYRRRRYSLAHRLDTTFGRN